MNDSSDMRPLIIGIGNPLRSDDGLGWAVAEQLAREDDSAWTIQAVHQLTPELAQSMARAILVVMIDASREGEPGEVHVHALALPARPDQPGAAGTHLTSPEELAALTTAVYGHCPPVVIIAMTGADFSIGERLSSVVAGGISRVCATVQQVCAQVL
jgi:hydrogenase maturation protease